MMDALFIETFFIFLGLLILVRLQDGLRQQMKDIQTQLRKETT